LWFFFVFFFFFLSRVLIIIIIIIQPLFPATVCVQMRFFLFSSSLFDVFNRRPQAGGAVGLLCDDESSSRFKKGIKSSAKSEFFRVLWKKNGASQQKLEDFRRSFVRVRERERPHA